MKNKYLKAACISVLLCIAAAALMGASPEPETAAVKRLLEKRTDIISNVLNGNITFDEGKNQLKTIESEKLYSDDISTLEDYRDTDYTEVIGMDIVSMEKESHIYDRLSFACVIEWTSRDYDGISEEIVTYTIGVSETGNEYSLISMEVNDADKLY